MKQLQRHPDAIPPQYNPYYVKPEIPEIIENNNQDLEVLKLKKEILEMELKLKELENNKGK